jgi:hypothetical protein
MSCSYNNVVYAGFELDDEYIVRNGKGEVVFSSKKFYDAVDANQEKVIESQNSTKIHLKKTEKADKSGEIEVKTENGYSKVIIPYHIEKEQVVFDTVKFDIISEMVAKLSNDGVSPLLTEENNFLKIKVLDKNGNFVLDANGNIVEKNFKESEMVGNNDNTAEKLFIRDIQQQKAADTFRNENSSFLWVQNIWVTDSPLKHPIELNWDTFNTTHEYLKEQPNAYNIGQSGYDNLTAKLTKEKNAPNGFFILVILTAGSSLLMQIVMNKSQKAQMELQTVDGQGAQTQKMMKWMMPIMMAIFSFMYTAAFSIYIILSSALSLGTTFLINFFVDRKFEKEEGEKQTQKIRGRIYTPKEEPKQEKQEPKKVKDDKFAHANGEDYLSLMAKKDQKQHIRGRLK